MKRVFKLFLIVTIVLTSFPVSPIETNGTITVPEIQAYRIGAWMEGGKFIFVAPNKKATSNIRYRTYAFVLRGDDKTTPANEGRACTSEDLHNSQCTPLRGTENQDYIIITLNNTLEGRGSDINECEYIKEHEDFFRGRSLQEISKITKCTLPNTPNEVVVYRFESPKEVIISKMENNPIFKHYLNGDIVYISTIFQVVGNTSNNGRIYSQLKNENGERGIYDAEQWANKSYFRNYYDRPVPFDGHAPVSVEYLHEDTSAALQNKEKFVNTDPKFPDGEWPILGSLNGRKVSIPDTITSNNEVYSLQCSLIMQTNDTRKPTCSLARGAPYWVRDGDFPERDPWVPIGGVRVVALYNKVSCRCNSSASVPDKQSVEGEVPVENSKIGKMVPVQIDLKQTEAELDNWKKWSADKAQFQIRVRLWRSDQTDTMTGLANTGAAPLFAKAGQSPNPQTTDQEVWSSLSKAQLLQLLDGTNSQLLYNDDLMNYPIPEGRKVSFRYNASIYIRAQDINGNWVTVQCTQKPSTEMTWFRPVAEKPETGTFFSVPHYFSEIKQGSPQLNGTGSNEDFDAMSGTPTTRHLYFASGGSEFIVDIEVEYVPPTTQTRRYTSEFNGVVNGWAMNEITGGWNNDSPPARPTARTRADACSASYTEQVVQESQPYVKGYTTGENPQPIWGTQYRWVQKGYPSTIVGGYVDTWTQTVTFDYMKINKAVVWKIDRSKVNGMTALTGTNEVTASITQGNPNIFYNIAPTQTSQGGRLRYTVEPNQHDAVYWAEGNSDNCLANNRTGPVNEQERFNQRRNTTGKVWAISDFLILQTSSGDQSVMYIQRDSNTAKTTEQLDVPVSSFDAMWTNNALSAASWDKRDTIKVGSYNGRYGSPLHKYSGAASGTVATIFDTMPAGKIRPARPAPYLRLMATNLDIPNALPNGEYTTGSSTIFYRTILQHNPGQSPVPYSTANNARYAAAGQEFVTAYSPLHSKVNDVVIHNPVSSENAFVISLPSSMDQRIPASQLLGGNKQEGVTQFERVLDPNYRQNVIPNADAEIVNVDDSVAGWHTRVASGSASRIAFTSRSGSGAIGGAHSFEVTSQLANATTGGYWLDVAVKPNTNYRFEGDLSCQRCSAAFNLTFYTAGQAVTGSAVRSASTTALAKRELSFRTPSNAATVRIYIEKGAPVPAAGQTNDHLLADNLKLMNMDVQEFVAVPPVYVTREAPNPDYVPPTQAPPVSAAFAYTGSVQTFTASRAGVYTLEVWGAAGGVSSHASARRGEGGYAKGDIYLEKDQVIHIYVGGQGRDYGSAGGWNGGGSGYNSSSDSAGGGGATDVRVAGQTLNHRVIVAGGGGGNGCTNDYGGHGGGLSGQSGVGSNYLSPGRGGTQAAGGASGGGYATDGSFGQGGNVTGGYGAGGGGGGWYGGGAGGSTSGGGNAGGGGSGYVGGVLDGTTSAGGNTGHGRAVISTPGGTIPAVGQPTITVKTLAGGSSGSPPSDAYMLIPSRQDPLTPAGGHTPGNFIVLDHQFQLYYPNTGDFYGNGQWGWAQTTSIRGKGYVNNMDTTEWTRTKHVKFGFHVIYNNVLYTAGQWIELPLNSPAGNYRYDFYVPLGNREKISALVEVKSMAINAQFEDNEAPTNRIRYANHAAKHSTFKKFNVDLIGRIGNFVIEDTGDFRFSNLFKQATAADDWFIRNVVHRVNPHAQHRIAGDTAVDIRGQAVGPSSRYLNTYGLLTHMQQQPLALPLIPSHNNIDALKNQPLRIGYDVLAGIQTIGNYYSQMQIVPHYYHLNLQNGVITPIDVYMKVDNAYKPVNRFGHVSPGWNPATVHELPVELNWDAQAARRNVSQEERDLTSRIAMLFAESGGDTSTGKGAEPFGSYVYGTAQLLQLTGRNRTYMGQDATYGVNRNPGNRLSLMEYAMQGQRWHFSFVLPSSAVAVRSGEPVSQANIDQLRTNTGVLLLAANIIAVGDTYSLRYTAPNSSITVAGVTWPLTTIPYPVVAVYSASRSSSEDLNISGTH